MKILNYIATTHNGYVFERVKICDYNKTKWEDAFDELCCSSVVTKTDGEICYCDIVGSMDDLELFLIHGTNSKCSDEYQNSKSNTLIEDWRTDVLGWYNGIYVGLEIQDVK